MVDGGFTKEQLAIAKQLQASYCSSGTFKSSSSNGSASRQQVGRQPAPPVRMPPSSGPVTRSQAGSVLRSSNGLVRPLPSGAYSATASRNVAGPTSKPNTIPPASVQKKKPVQSAPQQAPKPVQAPSAQVTATQKAPMQSAPKPAGLSASQPAAQSMVTLAHRPPPLGTFRQDLLSMEPLPVISTPTMVAMPVSQDTEMANSGFVTGLAKATAPVPTQAPISQEYKATPVAPASSKAPITDLVLNAPAAVCEAIKINQMGKPVLWNYMTEVPSVRELTVAEKEGLKALPPPGLGDRPPWTRAWHPNEQPLRIGPNSEIIDVDTPITPMKPVIGLMGSRHA
ncbi:hypothetical protein Sste5346_002847 [Sporothrix stenoceras]|uniref:Uncharacterized protein n=1 Tax=Sporothrix stenoceras TaxID=5173 RepID=A0ABR3ZGC2_9PEZI